MSDQQDNPQEDHTSPSPPPSADADDPAPRPGDPADPTDKSPTEGPTESPPDSSPESASEGSTGGAAKAVGKSHKSASPDKRPKESAKESAEDPTPHVPKAVVNRLSLYLRELCRLERDGIETTSSTQLGKLLGFSDAQVRKDLAYFGQFGYPGIGYRCDELIAAVRRILGADRSWRVAILGVGNLGRALLGYRGFRTEAFRIVAGFDSDHTKVGQKFDGIPVYAMDEFAQRSAEMGIRMAIIAVPAAAAQIVADRVVEAGVEGVLNFAPVTLTLPDSIHVVGVDLAMELEQLSFAVTNKSQSRL